MTTHSENTYSTFDAPHFDDLSLGEGLNSQRILIPIKYSQSTDSTVCDISFHGSNCKDSESKKAILDLAAQIKHIQVERLTVFTSIVTKWMVVLGIMACAICVTGIALARGGAFSVILAELLVTALGIGFLVIGVSEEKKGDKETVKEILKEATSNQTNIFSIYMSEDAAVLEAHVH